MLFAWIQSAGLVGLYILAIVAAGGALTRHLRGYADSSDVSTLLVSIGAGIFLLALGGALIAISPLVPRVTAICLAIAAIALAGFDIFRATDWYRSLFKQHAAVLLLWLAASLLSVSLTFVPAHKPPTLYDGPYVFKNWGALSVQIQALTGHLPPDNALPMVVTEYLARGIPFTEERPIMPGQEVSLRPILLALAALPARVVLGSVEDYSEPLPRFSYVGSRWPNTLSLVSNRDFRVFLALAVTLNALVTVAFSCLMRALAVRFNVLASVVFCVLSPFVIWQSIFTWPKNAAAFFIISALILLCSKHPRWLSAGAMMGLAYWCHPYALAFIGVTAAYLGIVRLIDFVRKRSEAGAQANILQEATAQFGALAYFVGAAGGAVVLWFAWSRIYLGIPGNHIAQALGHWTSLAQTLWVRVHNLYGLFFPTALGVNPYDTKNVVTTLLSNLWAPAGLTLLFAPIAFWSRSFGSLRHAIWIALLSGIATTAVFGFAGPHILHGWQAVWPFIVAPVLAWISERPNKAFLPTILLLQLAINLLVLVAWGSVYSSL